MNYSRYKTYLRIVTTSTKNLECNKKIGSRYYSKKTSFSSSLQQETEIRSKVSNKSADDKEIKQLYEYTGTSQARKFPFKNSLVKHSEVSNRQPPKSFSKYFIPKTKPKTNHRLDTEVTASELYPEGEIDEMEDFDNKKTYKNFVQSHDRVNYKLGENPKYAVEYLRDIESSENLEHCKDLRDLEKEIIDFEDREKKAKNELPGILKKNVKIDLTVDEFKLGEFMKQLNESIPGPLDECKENISDFGPNFSPTFNFAAYADNSKLIQTFTDLGVELYKVEKNQDHMRALLTVDLENELPKYIQFLHDCGVPADSLGHVITENPPILKEDLDDMKTRIRYLRAHDFSPESIARIVTKNPTWLTWATKCIDERLGHFQNEFKLSGTEIRFLTTKQPKLITHNFKHIEENTFAVREIMGFDHKEMKVLILSRPRLWMNTRRKIVESFDYLHNTMKLSHLMIITHSEVITTRKSRLKNRHEFLVELKKAQYDPKKMGYIAPRSIAVGSDAEFCSKVAKTSVDTYNLFLKTR